MAENPGSTDISNMGRCVVCGKPIDMRDEGSNLVVMEQDEVEHPAVDEQDVREAMADALRHAGGPKNYTLAEAYEDGDEIAMHEECHDETALPGLYASDEEEGWVDDAA